jgi:hypothetical protein
MVTSDTVTVPVQPLTDTAAQHHTADWPTMGSTSSWSAVQSAVEETVDVDADAAEVAYHLQQLENIFSAREARLATVFCVDCGSNEDQELMLHCVGKGCAGEGLRGLHPYCAQRHSRLLDIRRRRWVCAECVANQLWEVPILVPERPLFGSGDYFRQDDDPPSQVYMLQGSDSQLPMESSFLDADEFESPVTHISLPGGVLDPRLAELCDTFGHIVNSTATDGGGLARAVGERYPYANAFRDRVPLADQPHVASQSSQPALGSIQFDVPWTNMPGQQRQPGVFAMVAQQFAGKPKEMYPHDSAGARLRHFEKCLRKIADCYPAFESIAFPENIGAGLGGGNQVRYQRLIHNFARDNRKIDVYLVKWTDEPPPQRIRSAPAQPSGRSQSASSTASSAARGRDQDRASSSRSSQLRSQSRTSSASPSRQPAPTSLRSTSQSRSAPRECRYGSLCRDRQTPQGCRYTHSSASRSASPRAIRGTAPLMPTICCFERYRIPRRPPEGVKLFRPNYRESLPFVDCVAQLPSVLGLVDYRGDPGEAGIHFLRAYCPSPRTDVSPPLVGPFDEANRKHIWLDGFAGSCVAGIPATQGRFGLYVAMDIFPPDHENVRRMLAFLNRGGVIRAIYMQCVNRRFPTCEKLRNTIWHNWQLGMHHVRVITGSPECATSSTATRYHDFPSRGPFPALEPLTSRAKQDDAAMNEFMTLCEQIVDSNRPSPEEDSTTTAIIENPADGVFSQLPDVRRRVMFGGWTPFRADHCVLATHESPNKRILYSPSLPKLTTPSLTRRPLQVRSICSRRS